MRLTSGPHHLAQKLSVSLGEQIFENLLCSLRAIRIVRILGGSVDLCAFVVLWWRGLHTGSEGAKMQDAP
jgi:hypothetical protein